MIPKDSIQEHTFNLVSNVCFATKKMWLSLKICMVVAPVLSHLLRSTFIDCSLTFYNPIFIRFSTYYILDIRGLPQLYNYKLRSYYKTSFSRNIYHTDSYIPEFFKKIRARNTNRTSIGQILPRMPQLESFSLTKLTLLESSSEFKTSQPVWHFKYRHKHRILLHLPCPCKDCYYIIRISAK